jgi:hypothetical protein
LTASELSTPNLISKQEENSPMKISSNRSQKPEGDHPADLGDNTQSDVEAAVEMIQKV